MATVINEPAEKFEIPGPSYYDQRDIAGVRLGVPFHVPFLKRFGLPTQMGTIWLGTWGVLSVVLFIGGLFVQFFSGLTAMNGNVWELVRHYANLQLLPPDGLGMAPSLAAGGYWEINLLLWAGAVACWAGRCWERLLRYSWRPYLFFAWASAILLTTTIWVFRPIMMGTWAEAPGLGLNSDLDWAQNFSVLWGNLYYNPWHQLAIFFLFGSTMLWGMHGATILATSAEGSHHEVAEIKDMHSGSHKSMLFWRWTMGFNANPKTIHDWIWWFSVGVVVSSAIGIISTGWITNDWYVWGVDNGTVEQYGPMTRSAINQRPNLVKLQLPVSMPQPITLPKPDLPTNGAR
jgi:photosynthetic reaction center M subunit